MGVQVIAPYALPTLIVILIRISLHNVLGMLRHWASSHGPISVHVYVTKGSMNRVIFVFIVNETVFALPTIYTPVLPILPQLEAQTRSLRVCVMPVLNS